MDSRFLSKSTAALTPYTPGEQPRDQRYIKLNTNECPYPPSPRVMEAVRGVSCGDLRLYPDPDATAFTQVLAEYHGVMPAQVLACGGSDEVLAYAFMTFFDEGDKVYFPDITYGFYKVYADLFHLKAVTIPLGKDFTIRVEDYFDLDGNIFIANPNAPTGIILAPAEVESILRHNPRRLVVVDEAYVDFAPGMSCMGLIEKYDNLLVVQTFSKSRALAGMRLGAGYGNEGLISGMNRVKYSFNPYNLDRISLAAGIAAIGDRDYLNTLVEKIMATRTRTAARLVALGFTVLPSAANFLFCMHPRLSGEELYSKLRKNGILVRHFAKPRIENYVRITIGTDDEMNTLLDKVEEWS